jgi:hypothetical protein
MDHIDAKESPLVTDLHSLDKLKAKLMTVEYNAFYGRIISLHSNLIYWTNRLSHSVSSEQAEAKSELARCQDLLRLALKDLEKIAKKHDQQSDV